MLMKIILKNYRVNSMQYLSFYICNIVTLAVMFAFWGIVEAFLSADTNKLFLEISGELVMSGVIVTVVTILMMFYSLKSYVLYRLKDYSMMLVLGMRKKRFFLTLGRLVTGESAPVGNNGNLTDIFSAGHALCRRRCSCMAVDFCYRTGAVNRCFSGAGHLVGE